MRQNYSGNKRRKEEERRKYQEAKRLKRLNKSKNASTEMPGPGPETGSVNPAGFP